jgi:hypothetical protein
MFVEVLQSRHGRRQQGAYAPQFTGPLRIDIGIFSEPRKAFGSRAPLFRP